MELGARGGTDLEDVPLDRGILLVRLFPFPACPVCVSVSPRVRVCVYNNLSVCGRGVQVGRGWCQHQDPVGIYLSRCGTAAGRGFGGAGSRGSWAGRSAEPE